MTEPVRPYQPAQAPLEGAAAPQGGASLGVLLWSTVVLGVAGPSSLWQPWLGEWMRELAITGSTMGLIAGVSVVPALISPALAYLSDRVAVLDRRREGYLVLAGILGAMSWGAAVFVPHGLVALAGIGFALALASVVAGVATHGGLVEVAQRRRLSARLGVVLAAVPGFSILVWKAASPLLFARPFAWTAVVGVAAALSLTLLAIFLPESEPVMEERAVVPLRVVLRKSLFWGPFAVALCAGIPRLAAPSIEIHFRLMRLSDADRSVLATVEGLAIILGALVYLPLRRAFGSRRALPASLLIQAASTMGYAATAGAPPVAVFATSAGRGIADAALTDLVFRACPPGREASGFVLLVALPRALASALGTVLMMPPALNGAWPSSGLALPLAAVSALATLSVALLPRQLAE